MFLPEGHLISFGMERRHWRIPLHESQVAGTAFPGIQLEQKRCLLKPPETFKTYVKFPTGATCYMSFTTRDELVGKPPLRWS